MIRAPSVLALAATVMLSATLLACGGDDDNGGSEAGATATTQPAAATATSPAATATTAAAAPTATTAPAAPTATTAAPAPTATTAAAAPTATTAAQGGGTTQVSIVDFGYGPENLTGRVGQAMTIAVTNSGQAPHTFTIQGLTDTGTISAGQSRTVTFTPTAAGNLTFLCTIHGAGVMSGTLAVAP